MGGKGSLQDSRRIILLPSISEIKSTESLNEKPKKKVAAYARVSTETDEQQNSYEAQVNYYTEVIGSRRDWHFVKVYTDEGISGTSTAKREGFTEMINDALAGKIDLILTKSVSRFARNTVDSLVTIRKLKALGVEIFFEKENIWTFDGKGELLLTIMSSLAQEESRSISENIKWGIRRHFAEGKLIVGYKYFLGYDRGPDDNLVINEEQAKIVRLIFSEFLTGKSPSLIAKDLTKRRIITIQGLHTWNVSTITGILRNIKYTGDVLLQKTYVADFLTKKKIANHGEVPMYLVRNNHPAIITREQYEDAQVLLDKGGFKRLYKKVSPFSGILICGQCGSFYSPVLWHSNDKYRRVIWRCLNKYKNKSFCTTPHFYEEELKAICIRAISKLVAEADEVRIKDDAIVSKSLDTTELDKLRNRLNAKKEKLILKIEKAGHSRAMVEELKAIQDSLHSTIDQINEKRIRRTSITTFLIRLKELSKAEPITIFDESQFLGLVDHITFNTRTSIDVLFKDGTLIQLSQEYFRSRRKPVRGNHK